MKCLVINSENKEIKTVNVDDVTELFNLFKGEITSLDIDDQNVVIVEDIEMAFEELPYGFYFEGELINGNGIVIKFDQETGEYSDTTFDLESIKIDINF